MIRLGLVSARPVPASLVTHAQALLATVADDVATVDTSRPGWSGVALTGAARPDAAADVDVALAAELRGPATALGVDVGVTAGPLAE